MLITSLERANFATDDLFDDNFRTKPSVGPDLANVNIHVTCA